jgi:hypothetical protein
MAKTEARGAEQSWNPAEYAIPILAQVAGIAAGNEIFSVGASLAIAIAYLRIGWKAGAIVASAAAGLIISAAFFSAGGATANAAAHAAYWMAVAGVLAIAFERMAGRDDGGRAGHHARES